MSWWMIHLAHLMAAHRYQYSKRVDHDRHTVQYYIISNRQHVDEYVLEYYTNYPYYICL